MTERVTRSLGAPRLLGFLALAAALGCTGGRAAADEAPKAKVRVRRDIMTLSPDGPEIATLRRGVAVMKSRPLSDPRSWNFQVNIHATKDPSHPDVWNQCQHGNYFFLPWHRMYIYWFERLLRESSGDPAFTVPYWNYASPTARALPLPLREPANSSNPLYVEERNKDAGGVNHGARLPASAAATFWSPFRLTNFSTRFPTGASFGGRTVDRPVHLMPTMGSFESYHNVMHVLIGGDDGYMSDPTAASLDPVFLLHHANVDRLWNRWLDQGGGRANPLDDPTWMNMRFTFFNEKGEPETISVRETLDPEALGYRYDDDPPPITRLAPGPMDRPRPLRQLASSEGPPVDLGTEGPVRLTIELGPEARAAVEREQGTLAVVVEGVQFEKEPMVYYEVYLNLPATEAPDYQGVHYVGNLVFAGLPPRPAHGRQHPPRHGHHQAADDQDQSTIRAIDATNAVRELRGRKLWDNERLTVTFIMNGLIPVNHASVTRPGFKARFDRATLAGD